jgi:Xaa-Pro dipeptidase
MSNSFPTSNQSSFVFRQKKLATALAETGLEALVLNPGPSLVYLTGLHFHTSERPVTAFFAPNKTICLVLPELEVAKTVGLPFEMQIFPYGEDPASWPMAFQQAAQAAGIGKQLVGVEPTRLRVLELRLLEAASSTTRWVSAEASLAALRMRKDPGEIAAMRKAVDIAQRALQATLPQIKTGMSERELASELTLQLLRLGSDPEMPFSPIVSSGPNSANPHASPGDRHLSSGDLLVIDWGASYAGYFSDLTRTFAIGKVEPELEQIARTVLQANAAGRLAGRPGLPCGEVDRAARTVIEQAGYGQYFTHRTGHGLGMEGHEEPYIRQGNPLLLEEGMTYTVEPGIYLTTRNGVRIEDDMAVTATGSESLSDLPRELFSVG